MYRLPTFAEYRNLDFYKQVDQTYKSAQKLVDDFIPDKRPVRDVLCDYNYCITVRGDFDITIRTSVGKVVMNKFEYLQAIAQQIICDVPSDEAAPELPSRGTIITGQLKLFIDVFSLLRFFRKTDKVLVIGSNGANQKGGNAYLLLAGRVSEVHLYDPAEDLTTEKTIRGTLFKYFKKPFTGVIVGFDILFNDAYKDGGVVHFVSQGLRISSLKCLENVFDFRSKANIKGSMFVYGQLHSGERRITNIRRSYTSFHYVGSCPACIELGYFGGKLTEYELSILYRCHQTLPCSNNRGIISRKPGNYVDLFAGFVVSVRPYYYIDPTVPYTLDAMDYTRAHCEFSIAGNTYVRTIECRSRDEVTMSSFSANFDGPVVIHDERMFQGYDFFFGRGYFVVMGDVYVTDFGKTLNVNAEEFKFGVPYNKKEGALDVSIIPNFDTMLVQRYGIKKMSMQRFDRNQLCLFLLKKYDSYYCL